MMENRTRIGHDVIDVRQCIDVDTISTRYRQHRNVDTISTRYRQHCDVDDVNDVNEV